MKASNVSVRNATIRAGTPIAGFVLGGTGTKRMLVRACGPALAGFGVTGALADPGLSLVSGTATFATNDNWTATDASMMAARLQPE